MELIDKQQAFVTLTEHYQHRMLIQHLMLFEALCKVPTVEAIPVNWLTNLAKEYEESDNQFFRMDSCVIEDLIKRWKEEQEKQNGS